MLFYLSGPVPKLAANNLREGGGVQRAHVDSYNSWKMLQEGGTAGTVALIRFRVTRTHT